MPRAFKTWHIYPDWQNDDDGIRQKKKIQQSRRRTKKQPSLNPKHTLCRIYKFIDSFIMSCHWCNTWNWLEKMYIYKSLCLKIIQTCNCGNCSRTWLSACTWRGDCPTHVSHCYLIIRSVSPILMSQQQPDGCNDRPINHTTVSWGFFSLVFAIKTALKRI
jgi:hypothetical protein